MVSGDGAHVTRSYRKKALPMSVVRRILFREQKRIYARFAAAFPPVRSARVLNVGEDGEPETAFDGFFEQLYPYPEQITAAGLEAGVRFRERFPESRWVSVVRGRALPFEDDAFDVVFCNAVVEHVGDAAAQRAFLCDVLRVAPRAFVTTPNRWYPVELHTVLPLLHWLPKRVHRALLRRLGFAFFADEANLNLLGAAELRALVPAHVNARRLDVRIEAHRFLGLASNLLLIAERSAS
jgi:SAM-dependent methyltransferase